MLERVIMIPNSVSLGDLADAVVYYGNVEIVLQNGHIAKLIRQIGLDALIRVAESDLVQIAYDFSASAISEDVASLHPHEFYTVRVLKGVAGNKIRNAEDELNETFLHEFGRGVVSRRSVHRLARALLVREPHSKIVEDSALADIADQKFLTDAVQSVLRERISGYPEIGSVFAKANFAERRFNIHSNLNYEVASKLFSGAHGRDSEVKPGFFTLPILGMWKELAYSADARSDVWADRLQGDLMRRRLNSLFARRLAGKAKIDHFQEHVFPYRSFSQAVSTGERDIVEIIEFAEHEDTRRFKRWISKGPENGDLLAEYQSSKISPSSFANGLTMRTTKLLLFSAAGVGVEKIVGGDGVVGAVAGATLSNFIIDQIDERLLGQLKLGWRPSNWAAETAGPFLHP